ncbi:hypothetical protein [Gluconobacter albidus]|uniref:hypothetical protein n=1 Tax=Gluconobacter albidus TaxID=318683 RepID=UPI0011EA55B5|nr:hypothetical protein [Gluconobacter albidus]
MSGEPIVLDEDESNIPETEAEASALSEKLTLIKERCKKANIEFSEEIDPYGDKFGIVFLQSGRSKRRINIFGEDKADRLLSIDFENQRFLSGYEAICCYKDRTIEAGIRATRIIPSSIIRRLLNIEIFSESELQTVELKPNETSNDRPTIEIGPSSNQFNILSGIRGSRFSIKMRNIRASQHDAALSELRSYSSSLFFQIDGLIGSTFILERERQRQRLPLPRKKQGIELIYPKSCYNEDSMSLFMYAKSARDMPLLQFLGFYQSIEFYFPRYSQNEARRRVGSIVKNPTFRSHNDDDLDQLISAIRISKANGLGSERSQLRAVINECLATEEVRSFFEEGSDRAKYFASKSSGYHNIPVSNKQTDLRNDVADRIYDIRCKIVHTKNEHSEEESVKMILPFSDDAESLLHDIDLVQFVARKVLIAGSTDFV